MKNHPHLSVEEEIKKLKREVWQLRIVFGLSLIIVAVILTLLVQANSSHSLIPAQWLRWFV
jgi:hypothetical protein